MDIRFIADTNVGKLAKWLRIMGYDTLFFKHIDDASLVDIALNDNRILLTRDTFIPRRRLVTGGMVTVILITREQSESQLEQVMETLALNVHLNAFSRCIECNEPLFAIPKEEIRSMVPAYVFQTQDSFMQCARCDRVYWRGTHWERMKKKLEQLGLTLQ